MKRGGPPTTFIDSEYPALFCISESRIEVLGFEVIERGADIMGMR